MHIKLSCFENKQKLNFRNPHKKKHKMNDSFNVTFISPTKLQQLPAKNVRPDTPRPGAVIEDPMKKVPVKMFTKQPSSQRTMPKTVSRPIPNRFPGLSRQFNQLGRRDGVPQKKRERLDLNLHEEKPPKARKTDSLPGQQNSDEFEAELETAFCQLAAKVQEVFMKHKSPSQAYDAYRRVIILHQKLAK